MALDVPICAAMAIRIQSRPPRAADGRQRRSERSRDAIVQALYQLTSQGELEPTAQQVAARARVGIRSVFRHFADMDSLYAELGAQVRAEVVPLMQAGFRGTPSERARELVARRARVFEVIGPHKRAANLARRRSLFLQRQHVAMVRELRAALLRALPEVAAAPAELVDALDLALSFESWDRLRSDQRLSRERAAAVVERTVLNLVSEILRTRRGRTR